MVSVEWGLDIFFLRFGKSLVGLEIGLEIGAWTKDCGKVEEVRSEMIALTALT